MKGLIAGLIIGLILGLITAYTFANLAQGLNSKKYTNKEEWELVKDENGRTVNVVIHRDAVRK